MPTNSIRSILALLGLCLIGQVSVAGAGAYHHTLSLDLNGKPTLQLTNDSELPIVAFFMVEFPSLGMEGRTYYDYHINQRELPIPRGATVTRGLSSFEGAEEKVRAEVRAVIFQDGSTAGDPVWVNAILARRLRLYDRTLSLYNLLERQVDTGISREALVALLKKTQDEADRQLPEDDLRVMDDLAFYGAISTVDKNRQVKVETILERYLAYLRWRAEQLQRSRPRLDRVHALPVSVPKPLSNLSLPADLVASRAAQATYSATTTGSPSFCEILNTALNPAPVTLLTCNLNGEVQNEEYTFVADTFTRYNAVTKQTTNVGWTSPANLGPFKSFGVCYGPYTNCSNDPNDYYYIPPGTNSYGAASRILSNPVTKVLQGQSAAQFYWTLDQYPYPTEGTCDQCDPDPNGQNPSSINAPIATTVWSFDYACTVH